jgi:hypothetical protein
MRVACTKSGILGVDGEPRRDNEMDLIVMKLRQVSREASLDYAIRIGSVIVHYFYGGDVSAWRARGPKPTSFRRLAARPDLPMSPSVLYRCVAIFELCERLGVVSRWRHVTASHLRAVLNLDAKEQVRLLAAVNAEGWSVQRLEEHTRCMRPTRTSMTSVSRKSPLVKFLIGLEGRIESSLTPPERDILQMTRAQRELIVSRIEAVTNQLNLIRRSICEAEAG